MRWRLPSKPRCRFPKLVSDRVRRSLTCLVPQSGPSPTMGAPWRTSQMQHRGTTRASDTPFAARPNRMVRFRRLSLWPWPMLFPVRNWRSFLLRLYSAWGTQDFEPSRPGDRLIRSGAIVANDGLISRRGRLAGMLRIYYREAANVIARIVGQNAFQSQSQRFIAIT